MSSAHIAATEVIHLLAPCSESLTRLHIAIPRHHLGDLDRFELIAIIARSLPNLDYLFYMSPLRLSGNYHTAALRQALAMFQRLAAFQLGTYTNSFGRTSYDNDAHFGGIVKSWMAVCHSLEVLVGAGGGILGCF